jgi:CheY-like chemotaxis protein
MPKPTVLYIIDDDREDRDFLIEALKEIDPSIEFFTAINGQEGLKKLNTNSIPIPSIIFLDLHMPRINGKQFLIEIQNDAAYNSIPVIIYTTSSNQKEIDEMMQLGATGYLVKQWDYTVLKEKLNAIFAIFSE